MDYRVNQLFEIAIVFAAVAATAAVLVVGSIWIRRTYRASAHARTSRQRRREGTRIDLIGGGEEREQATREQRSHRPRRSRRDATGNNKIDLFSGRPERKPEDGD